jgi:hypothetical protein
LLNAYGDGELVTTMVWVLEVAVWGEKAVELKSKQTRFNRIAIEDVFTVAHLQSISIYVVCKKIKNIFWFTVLLIYNGEFFNLKSCVEWLDYVEVTYGKEDLT